MSKAASSVPLLLPLLGRVPSLISSEAAKSTVGIGEYK